MEEGERRGREQNDSTTVVLGQIKTHLADPRSA